MITEATYLARRYPLQQDQLLRAVAAGEFPLLALGERDMPVILDIMRSYRDQEIDLADAALVHLARRERIGVIFTVDRRHFTLFRRLDGKPFRLLPNVS